MTLPSSTLIGNGGGKQSQAGTTKTGKRKRGARKKEEELDSNGSNDMAEAEFEMEQQLVPTSVECSKLASIVKMLDRHGVGSEILPDEAGVPSFLDALDAAQPGWPHALSTLDFYLDLASSSVKARLSARLGKGKAPAIAGPESLTSFQSIKASEAQVDGLVATMKKVLDEIKEDGAKRTGMYWTFG